MTADSNVQSFLVELRERLRADPAVRDRILSETEDHLAEAIERLEKQGVPAADAVRQAIARYGSPAQIADAYAAEPARQQEGDRRFMVTRWKAFAAVAALVALVIVGSLAWDDATVSPTPVAETQVQKPFTATSHMKFFDESGVERSSGTVVMYFRSDGSKATSGNGYVAVSGRSSQRFRSRSVVDRAANIHATVLPDYNLISTTRIPRRGDPEFFRWNISAPKHCSILMSALEADPETERNNILGYEVLKHDYARGHHTFHEVWVAPELDCYELRSSVWELDLETGERKHLISTRDVVSVTEGEPAGDRFQLPESFEEAPPSRMIRASRDAWGPLGRDVPEAKLVALDQDYDRLRLTTR